MQTQDAYNNWANTYDSVINKTRDLEAIAIRAVLKNTTCNALLEIGCGTGKNTIWLQNICQQLTAIDFSVEMMQLAKQKINSTHVIFKQVDITKTWQLNVVDVITCSLVLEHIENIDFIFQQAATILEKEGQFYICELHPYKQLQGSRAKFQQNGTEHHLEYFIHHISDFMAAAKQHGFICSDLQEWFDTPDKTTTPRLVSYLFKKV